MKNLLGLVFALVMTCGFVVNSEAQMAAVKRFDYSELENKTLYLPVYVSNSAFAKRLAKRGKTEKLQKLENRTDMFNEIWEEAMATSVYDATPYEIRGYNSNKLFKEKNTKAIILRFSDDDNGNEFANLWVTGPKRRLIATTIINGLNLLEASDLRLMMNMLNYSLNMAVEIEDDGKAKGRKGVRNKYKEGVIEFADNIEDQTFVVPRYSIEDVKKPEKKNAAIKEAMKLWKICPYEIQTVSKIEDMRASGESDIFYWRSFPIYTNIQGIAVALYNANYFFTTERDEIVYYWLGGKKLKTSSVEKAQKGIIEKAARYKRQLAD